MCVSLARAQKRHDVVAVIMCLSAILLSVILLSLPVFRFSSEIWSKKYSNTDIGSAKYSAAYEEAESFAADCGFPTKINEARTQRTNSKGAAVTTVALSITVDTECTGWDVIVSGLPSGVMLAVMLGCAVLSLAIAVSSYRPASAIIPHRLSRSRRCLRMITRILSVSAVLLVPIVAMSMNRLLSRDIRFAVQDGMTDEVRNLIEAFNRLLFAGKAGNRLNGWLAKTGFTTAFYYWLLIPALFMLLPGCLHLLGEAVKKSLSRMLLFCFIIAACVIILYPYFVMLVTAFRTPAEANDIEFRRLLPSVWVWSNLRDIIDRNVLTYLGNSLLIALGATITAMVCGIPAAYALARMRFKGEKFFLGFIIISQMFSPIVLLVGISQLMNILKLNDTLLGLVLINAAMFQAFDIWLLRNTFISISPEMEQAARIDGCSMLGALVRVLLPVAAPGIVAVLIFVFIDTWNEYTISSVLISTPSLRPITVGITQFASFSLTEWHYLFATSLIATIPVAVLFMCIEKHLASGLMAGGIKG